VVEEGILRQVSDILHVPVEAFRNFDEEQAVIFISNTFDNGSVGFQKNEQCTFNPIDKVIQLHEEKFALYERMLKEKDEMMARLERLMDKRG